MFIELAKKRRSVKQYTSQEVGQEKIHDIIEAGLRAPSGRAIRPWEFVVVRDRELLSKLSIAKPQGAEFLKDAAVAVVVCADPSKSHIWIEDCAIAAVTMQYAAHSMGLGSRWSHMRDNIYNSQTSTRDYIAEILGLPDHLEVECIIAMGYAGEEMIPYQKEELAFDKVNYDRYGRKKH
jgi:nitroreductase